MKERCAGSCGSRMAGAITLRSVTVSLRSNDLTRQDAARAYGECKADRQMCCIW